MLLIKLLVDRHSNTTLFLLKVEDNICIKNDINRPLRSTMRD